MKVFTEPPEHKRKRHNKNKKKAWRKKIDITDVIEGLEEKRREERLGGPLEEKSLDEFLSLDLGGEKKEKKKAPHKKRKLESLEPGLKPTIKRKPKNLRCQEFLNGLPGVKAIAVKKGTMKQKPSRILKLAMKLRENTPKAHLKKKSIAEQRKESYKKLKEKHASTNCMEDIWNREEKKELAQFNVVGRTFMEAPMAYYKEQTKTKKPKIPVVLYQRPSSLPAVMIPKPGQSYNPTYEDYQKLLAEVEKEKEAKQKLKEKEMRLNKKYIPSKKDGISQAEYIQEMSEGIAFLNDGNQEEIEEMAEMYPKDDQELNDCISGHKIQGKKSKQTRKKAITLKIEERKRMEKKLLNQRESEVLCLKSFGKEFERDEAEKMKLIKKQQKKKEEDKFKPKQLSQHKFQEEDILVAKKKDLASNIRTIVTTGHPLRMNYKHLQRRNIIDTRVRVKKAKANSKEVVKKPYKEEVGQMLSRLTEDGIII